MRYDEFRQGAISKIDLQLPDDIELSGNIRNKFNEGIDDVLITTICAIGNEKIISLK